MKLLIIFITLLSLAFGRYTITIYPQSGLGSTKIFLAKTIQEKTSDYVKFTNYDNKVCWIFIKNQSWSIEED